MSPVVCLDSSGQETCGTVRTDPEKGHEDDKRDGAALLGGQPERLGGVS